MGKREHIERPNLNIGCFMSIKHMIPIDPIGFSFLCAQFPMIIIYLMDGSFINNVYRILRVIDPLPLPC